MSAIENHAAEAQGINKRFGPIEVLHDVGDLDPRR